MDLDVWMETQQQTLESSQPFAVLLRHGYMIKIDVASDSAVVFDHI